MNLQLTMPLLFIFLFKLKDLQLALRPDDRAQVEKQLLRYMKVVGPQLSERMVYLLG